MTDVQSPPDPGPETRKSRDWAAITTIIGVLVLALLLLAAFLLIQPRRITIRIDGPAGARFLGKVNVDGRETLVTGGVPAELTFRGRRVTFNLVPDGGSTEGFSVRLADQQLTSEHGVGGWYDARTIIPDVHLQPVTEDEWLMSWNAYRLEQSARIRPAPAQ